MATNCKHICKIDYSPALAKVAGDAAANLAGMIRRWCQVMKREIWKSNDELMSELGLSRYQFEQARAMIATRIRTGDSKSELQRVRDEGGNLAPVSRIILYWKDRQNKMWYWVNEELFAAWAGVPYGMRVAEGNDQQTIGNVEAEGTDQQTIVNYPKQETDTEKTISFSGEEREELPACDDWRLDHVVRLWHLPDGLRLIGIEGDVWRIEGRERVFAQLRVLQAEIRKNWGGTVEYVWKGAGDPAWKSAQASV